MIRHRGDIKYRIKENIQYIDALTPTDNMSSSKSDCQAMHESAGCLKIPIYD